MVANDQPGLVMVRTGFGNLPPIQIPTGYCLRSFRDGEETSWLGIIRRAFDEPSWDEARYHREMLEHAGYAADRIYFVCDADGQPCATASAFRTNDDRVGHLHWVGTDPAYAGHGLGGLVSLQALHRFREDGLGCATLKTNDHRLAAIKTYLRLGFRPTLTHQSHADRWRIVLQQLGDGALLLP